MDRIFLATNSSEIDSLIEKLRAELSAAVSEDECNDRGSTVLPIKYDLDSDIHNRISNLETCIQKLHDEVIELSKNTAHMVKACMTFDCKKNLNENTSSVIFEKHLNVENYDNHSMKDITELVDEEIEKKCSRVFPITIRNMMLPMTSGSKLEEVNTNNDEESKLPNGLKDIKLDVMSLWGDLQEYGQKDNLEGLIQELQTEINERLETLKDVDIDTADAEESFNGLS